MSLCQQVVYSFQAPELLLQDARGAFNLGQRAVDRGRLEEEESETPDPGGLRSSGTSVSLEALGLGESLRPMRKDIGDWVAREGRN